MDQKAYLAAVSKGQVHNGDLVISTKYNNVNGTSFGSSGYDTALFLDGGLHNGNNGLSLSGPLAYGSGTRLVYVLRPPDAERNKLLAGIGLSPGSRSAAVAGRGGGLDSIKHPFKPLLALIMSGESDPRAPTPWDSINRRRAGDTPGGRSGLSQMTIGQIQRLQAQGKLYAVGAFQIIPETLRGVLRDVGLGPNAPFSPSNQVKLALGLISGRPALHSYLTGKVPDTTANLRHALADLKREWASVLGLDGRSHYADGGSIKASEALAALREARKAYVASRSG
jgi:hypothetical protein